MVWVHNWLTCSQLTVWRYMFVSLIWYVPTYVVILDDSFPTRVVFQYTQVGVNNSLCCIHIQNINQLTQYIYIVPISRTYTNVIWSHNCYSFPNSFSKHIQNINQCNLITWLLFISKLAWYSSMYKLVPTYVVILDTQVGANLCYYFRWFVSTLVLHSNTHKLVQITHCVASIFRT